MDKNLFQIASLAMDLKRVALAYYNGSEKTGRTFLEESLKKIDEIEEKKVKNYLFKYLEKIPGLLNKVDKKKLAEDALMYSTIFQNYVISKK